MTTEAVRRLDEQSLRRPDFKGGEPIALDDGQAWCFPKPCIVYRPRFGPAKVSAGVSTDLGPGFDEAVAGLDAALAGEAGGRTVFDSLFQLAVTSLRINYALSDDQLVGLLSYRPDDESSQDTWSSIVDVARGHAPKQIGGMRE